MDENHKLTNYYKKLIAVILIASIIATSFSSVVQISAQSEGTDNQSFQAITSENISVQTSARPDEPTEEIVLSNENDFAEFMTKPELWESNYRVILTRNIDMKGKAIKQIKEFCGVFDGCGYTVSNLKIQNKSGKCKNSELAFIKTVNISAQIKNVTFENYIINGESNVNKAGFILENHGIISNVDIKDGSINNINKNAKVAGFVVKNSGSITKSSAEMSLDKGGLVGGFVSENDGNIEKSSFKGNVESKICSGGFCSSNSGKIDSCKSEGNVIAKTKSRDDVTICGGFVGENSGIIRNSSSTGTVNGQEFVGGFVGINNDKGKISSCKSISDVESKTYFALIYCGGFVGLNKGEMESCVFNGKVNGCLDGETTLAISATIAALLETLFLVLVLTFSLDKFQYPYDLPSLIIIPSIPSAPIIGFGVLGCLSNTSDCYAHVGGLCGHNLGKIIKCNANTDSIKAKTLYNKYNRCGGFVGTNGEIGTIKNSGATGKEICNETYTGGSLGGFVGENIGKIENGTTTISVANGKCTGGFCGNNSGEISSSKSEGNATADAKTLANKTKCGGFVGNNNEKGKIDDCISTGSVIGQEYVGGFCGDNIGEISKSKSEGNAKASTKVNTNKCGGFVGNNDEKGNINSCTSTGNAIGEEYVGGFSGVNKSDIIDCNAQGKATAKTKTHTALAGGFVGENEKGTIIDCISTGGADSRSTSDQAKAGGFVGINRASIIGSKANGYVYLSAGTCHKDDGCGGFVGKNDQGGSIDGCYTECIVETTNKKKGGGFVGEAENKSLIKNSKCKSKIVTKSGVKNQTKFYEHKYKNAVIEKCASI